ncbi:MAG: 2-aminoethylphosphonate--pyruvate transaminase [Pseudomonadota bacterium]
MTLNPAASPTGDPWLLTPGPLTTSPEVKESMLHDYGSRDAHFIDVNRRVRERLVELVGGAGEYVCVPLQGSGTFVVEAMLGTLVPRDGKLLVLVNGAYGKRIVKICQIIGRETVVLETPEDTPNDIVALDRALAADPTISHVATVHCETTSGILNPLAQVAEIVAHHGRALLVDAMSAFGAVPLTAGEIAFDAVVASSNKCIQGVPGVGFCIVRQASLEAAKGNAHSLALDLHDQWVAMEANAQWRFTPPTHAILAFERALEEHRTEGGVAGRGRRYGDNCRLLVDGMERLGFKALLPAELQAPIIVTFHQPTDASFDFQVFYDSLRAQGYVIYPGKLTVADTFRIGCIGALGATEIRAALGAIERTLQDMGVTSCAPAAA